MSEKLQEFVEIPKDFIKDGNQVRAPSYLANSLPVLTWRIVLDPVHETFAEGCVRITSHPVYQHTEQTHITEFAQICKAVAVGFAVMGFIGYFVKLIHIPM